MKGLLLKDWYQAKRYCRMLLCISVVFAAVSVFADNLAFAYYPLLMGVLLPVTLHAYDERSRFLPFCCTLPVPRRAIVAVRYLEMGLVLLLGIALLLLAQLVGMACGVAGALRPAALVPIALLALLTGCVLLPLLFRFGTEKARLLMFLFVGAFCAAVLLWQDALAGLLSAGPALLLAAAAAVLLLFPLSWALSVRIYRRREF